MKYELVECELIEAYKIESIIAEFTANGEICNALWRPYEIGVDKWQNERKHEKKHHELVLGFMIENCLVGIARITPLPNHEANGKVGYYIRPSYRRLGYGTILLHLIEDYCIINEIYQPTAVSSADNHISIRTLHNAGWLESGKEYIWTTENRLRKALEFRPQRLCRLSENRGD